VNSLCGLESKSGKCESPKQIRPSGTATWCRRHAAMWEEYRWPLRAAGDQPSMDDFRKFMRRTLAG